MCIRDRASLAVGAASKRLSDLEHSLGTQLMERHSRGVTLTQAGHALHRHAQRILRDVDQMAADLSDYASGVIGVARLWANTSAVTQFLPHQVSSFTRLNPGIQIELEESNSQDVVMAVLDGRADLCVTSRTIIWAFMEQIRARGVPFFHGLHRRFALQR